MTSPSTTEPIDPIQDPFDPKTFAGYQTVYDALGGSSITVTRYLDNLQKAAETSLQVAKCQAEETAIRVKEVNAKAEALVELSKISRGSSISVTCYLNSLKTDAETSLQIAKCQAEETAIRIKEVDAKAEALIKLSKISCGTNGSQGCNQCPTLEAQILDLANEIRSGAPAPLAQQVPADAEVTRWKLW